MLLLFSITTSVFAAGFGRGGGSSFSGGLFDLISNVLTSKESRNISAPAFIASSTTATSTFAGALAVGTTTKASAKIQIYDGSGTLGSYGMFRVISNDSSGGNYDIRIDSPNPDIELIESDQTSPAGKFEIAVNGNDLQFNSRNGADNSFENMAYFNGQTSDGGQFILVASTTSSTRDLLRIDNQIGSAGACPGISWYNSIGAITNARLCGNAGSSYLNSNLRFEVADSSKVLQERMRIDVNGYLGIGTTSPTEVLEVDGNIRLSNPGWLKFNNGTIGDLVQYKSSDGFLTMRDYGNDFTGAKLWSVGDVVTGDTDAVLSLVRSDASGTNSEFLDLYANGYTSSNSKIFGIAIQKRGTGSFRDFAFTTSDGSTIVRQMTIDNTNNRIGIGTTSPATLLDIFSTATTTQTIDSDSITQGACIKLKDMDGVGYTYVYGNNGTLTASTISCE